MPVDNPESLRTRIAEVIADAIPDHGIGSFDSVADAVIRELGLHPVETLDRRYMRWATKWQNNPEWNGGE